MIAAFIRQFKALNYYSPPFLFQSNFKFWIISSALQFNCFENLWLKSRIHLISCLLLLFLNFGSGKQAIACGLKLRDFVRSGHVLTRHPASSYLWLWAEQSFAGSKALFPATGRLHSWCNFLWPHSLYSFGQASLHLISCSVLQYQWGNLHSRHSRSPWCLTQCR